MYNIGVHTDREVSIKERINMGMNIGYLTANRNSSGDEIYTPYYAVEPLFEFLPKDKIIWCPFDEEWSAFYNGLTEGGVQGSEKLS